MITISFDIVTLTLKLAICFSKCLALVIMFEPEEVRLLYFTCAFLVTGPYHGYHSFIFI